MQGFENKDFNGKFNKRSTIEKLMSIIENNSNEQVRVNSLETLNRLDLLNDEHFEYLEDLSVSDQSINVRSIAVKIVIQKFFEQAQFLIDWIIQTETNPSLLFNVIESLDKKNQDFLTSLLVKSLNRKINLKSNRIIEKYNKEIKDIFRQKPAGLHDVNDLKKLYINYNFIINLETKFHFSENPNSSSLLFFLENGFITELRIWGLNLTKVSDLNGIGLLTDLKILDLSGNNLREIDGLEKLTQLKLLKFGDLNYDTGNQISEIKGLSSLTRPKILNLSNNNVKEIKGLEDLKNLEFLFLVNNSITEIKGIENLKNLKYFNLEKNFITRIKNANNLTNLETLVLGNNQISKLENINDLFNLKEIRINNNPLTEVNDIQGSKKINLIIHASEVERMSWLKNIKHLNIKTIGNEKPKEYCSRYYQ